jgi:hypothetical protein
MTLFDESVPAPNSESQAALRVPKLFGEAEAVAVGGHGGGVEGVGEADDRDTGAIPTTAGRPRVARPPTMTSAASWTATSPGCVALAGLRTRSTARFSRRGWCCVGGPFVRIRSAGLRAR